MRQFILVAVICISALTAKSQHIFKARIIDKETRMAVAGATVSILKLNKSAAADSAGFIRISDLSVGTYLIKFTSVGFREKQETFSIPLSADEILVFMEEEHEEEEEIIVQSTRTSRTIQNVPTRVETISLEEIDEKANMRPANVSMILHESTGIQVQQTSATSGNASIRIQGLDGRYTQLLKDGFANFGNFASGLSLLEIPPLDLKQVEIIKGPVSPLYGGGAIAGVVNFISKTPKEKSENSFLLNQSSIGQSNFGYFSSRKKNKVGYTFLGMFNKQKLYDVDKDDFTEVPRSYEFIIHPKVFLYPSESAVITLANSFTKGNRKAGDVNLIEGGRDSYHTYFEENNTIRNTTTLEFNKNFSTSKILTVKQSFSIFDRHIEIPVYHFDGISYNSFTDISFLANLKGHSVVAGTNFIYDKFNENNYSFADRDNKNFTIGLYGQDTWDISEKVKLESGLRFDHVQNSNELFSRSEFFVLPRFSLLVKYSNNITSRIGAGMGYKIPTLFTEETETIQYRNVAQLDNVRAERSYGGTADINVKTELAEDLDLSFNHMFFYTWIKRPLVLSGSGFPDYFFINADKPVISKGFETNAKFIYKNNLKLFLGYTFTDVNADYLSGNSFLPLVPKHKFNSALIFEKHELIKLGLEGYYTGVQYLKNGMRTSDFWEFGFMVEKLWPRFSIFVNFENFTDMRQSNYKRVANDPHSNPTFDDIWTHTEGFVMNGGIKLRL